MAEKEAALTPYRVLDLTTERGLLCGKIFADLGAEVIKIEPPEGDCGRDIGPFYRDISGRENSLFWFAFNTGKKSITLDIETTDGQRMLKKLVKTADFLIESFDPGYLDGLGIGYSTLSEINPRLMMGSISPFGQEGPYSQWKGPDIVPWAMSGYMWMTGEPESAPLRISSPPQTYLHASAMTVAGLLMALRYRDMSGQGQYIDTSAQQCPTWMLTHTYAYWDLLQVNLGRAGALRQFGESFIRTIWPCKDGYIILMAAGGAIGAKGQRRLIEMLGEEGIAEDLLEEIRVAESSAPADGQEDADRGRADRLERAQRLREAFGQLFETKTKAELLKEAVTGDFMLAPVSTVADLLENPQLKDRDYWVEVEHPELGTTITYPGAPCKLTETPWRIKGRAPLIGEHNNEIYRKDPGLSEEGNDHSAKRWNTGMGERVEDKRPLDGVKVLDFTTTVLGPTVTRYLAEHGATVVRVESMIHPETTRTTPPYAEREPGIDRSGYFATHNADKLSLSLDMGKAKAIVVAKRLHEWPQIVM